MLTFLRSAARRPLVIVTVLALTVLATERRAERYGDRLQIALPLLAWGCSALNGQAAEFALRYAVMLGAVHGAKTALGDAPINIRPNGGDAGMPSAHTSTAVLGASSLVHDCVAGNPVVQGVVLLTAGFVGASRIEAQAHDIRQVLAGAIAGWVCDRALRRPSPARRRVGQVLAGTGRALRAARHHAAGVYRRLRPKIARWTGFPDPMFNPSIRPTSRGVTASSDARASNDDRSESDT